MKTWNSKLFWIEEFQFELGLPSEIEGIQSEERELYLDYLFIY